MLSWVVQILNLLEKLSQQRELEKMVCTIVGQIGVTSAIFYLHHQCFFLVSSPAIYIFIHQHEH